MKRIIILLLYVVISNVMIYAVKAYPGLISKQQSDGSVISFYVHGDEFFNYITSEDGYMLMENHKGILEYARITSDCNFELTGIKASNIHNRSYKESLFLSTLDKADAILKTEKFLIDKKIQKAKSNVIQKIQSNYPLSGSPKSLVILVNFSDNSFTSNTVKQDFTRLLNEKGYSDNGGTGCAVDYFEASSNGVFSPNFIVEGPYTLPHEMSWYGGNNNYGDVRPGNMIIDACDAADATVDFREYDTDGDGVIDNVFVYYAGYNEAEGGGKNTIWPHRSYIDNYFEFDGVRIKDYACTSEFRGHGGKKMCGIGTFCHEFGHVLGLPDWYATNNANHPTLETWDIMDAGSYNNNGCTPPAYSSYERFFLGWLKPKQLLNGGTINLPPLVTSNEAYILAKEEHNLDGKNPDPIEFFMLENRQKIGADLFVPATGLLVTHVVYDKNTWDDNTPNNDPKSMGVSIYCASGTTNFPEINTFPGGRGIDSCTLTLRNGNKLPIPLVNIEETNEYIVFDYPLGDYPIVNYREKSKKFDVIYGSEVVYDSIKFDGNRISNNLIVSVSNNSPIKIRKKGGVSTDFFDTLIFSPQLDSTILCDIELKFEPKICTYNIYNDSYIKIECPNYSYDFPVKWRASRPIKVIPPSEFKTTDITPYAFTANWNSVDDATEYYISIYDIKNEESSETEHFSDFSNNTPIGWKSTFNKSVSDASSAPQAVLFNNVTDTLWTKKYFVPLSRLSFWINSVDNNNVGEGGVLYIDGFGSNNQWINIDKIEISLLTFSEIIEKDLSQYSVMHKFRFYYVPKKGTGGVALDDFTAYFDKKIEYVVNDSIVTDTLFRVNGLSPNTLYEYKIKASDKDREKNPPRYNNITDYSSSIPVMTLKGPSKERELAVIKNVGGTYTIFVPDFQEAYSVFVYSLDGRLVKVINSDSDTFEVSGLINGNIYILKYAERGKMRRKTKVAKLYYNVRN